MSLDSKLSSLYGGFTRAIFLPTDNGGIEFFGSGSILEIEDRFYLFTAGHVLDQATDQKPLLLECTNGLLPITGTGSTSHSRSPRRRDDRIDVAVVELSTNHHAKLKNTPLLKLANLDEKQSAVSEIGYLVMGYPETWNRESVDKSKRTIQPFRYALRSWKADLSKYNKLNVMESDHLLLNFNAKRVFSPEGKIRHAIGLKGLSGSPIWGGTADGKAVVVAVLTEHHAGAIKCIVSTRISHFLAATHQLRRLAAQIGDS